VIRFRRLLYGETFTKWEEMKRMVGDIHLDDQKNDVVRCTIGQSSTFKVKDMYLQLRSARIYPYKFIWKVKMPFKVKVLILLVSKNYILIKDNLLRSEEKMDWQYPMSLLLLRRNLNHLLLSVSLLDLCGKW
jgi:hypothetical protein